MNASILIIDDEPQLRRLLRITLQAEGFQVLEASSGNEGITEAATKRPDLILLDLGLPDQNGHDVLKHLREWFVAPIIIFSVKDGTEDVAKALDNGANDYMTKPFRSEGLLARIRAAVRNFRKEKNVPTAVFGDLSIDFVSRTVTKGNSPVKLTLTEYRLLCVLAQNEGKVLTHQSLLFSVWGPENENDTQYLRVFIGNLRKKIESDPNHPAHIVSESGVGYRFVDTGFQNEQRTGGSISK
jgi:two-component system KDP operon response regulator KdpE